jgi:hypothetical protein
MVLAVSKTYSQSIHLDRFDGYEKTVESRLDSMHVNFHTSVKPYFINEVQKVCNASNPTYEKVVNNNIRFKKSGFVTLEPLLDFEAGKDLMSKDSYIESGIGFSLKCGLASKVGFGGEVMYNQSEFPDYVDNYITARRVVPGQGYAYSSSLGGYNYLNYSFYVNYDFLKYFNIEAGFGKNFWGDGYRSLLLSDNSYNYPYFKISTNIWNIKFINIFANFKDMTNVGSTKWLNMKNKFATMQYLDWNISRHVSVGLYESIIWEAEDTTGYRGFDVNYLNPVIFYRPVEFSVGSPDNSMMGLNLRVKVSKRSLFYGQLFIDDIMFSEVKTGLVNRVKKIFNPNDSTLKYGWWTNKQAFQLGFKSYSLFGLKNLDFQAEVNFVRPYTYAHRRVIENYGNYNEPLAHPAGANLREGSFFLRYNYKKWYFEFHANLLTVGYDTTGTNNGQDIYKSVYDTYDPEQNNTVVKQYGNVIGQGIKTNISYYSLKVSYLIIPQSNLRVEAGAYYRNLTSEIKAERGVYIYLGIKTSIFKRYYDYF